MSRTLRIRCLDCGEKSQISPLAAGCPVCGSPWLQAEYDLGALEPSLLERASSRPFDMWRYLEALPVFDGRPDFSMGEGGTPLLPATNLGLMLGMTNLFIKDERQGPSGSFKDRQAALTMGVLKELGVSEAVVASTGNVAISFSAYGARAGVKIWAFLTSQVPADKMHEVALYGSQVVKVTSSYDQAKRLAVEFANRRGLYIDRGARSLAALESMKTIAYEIAEQLGDKHGWRAPDWYVQSVSGGLGPLGVHKGFAELENAGWIDRVPALGVVQAAGCAPMVEAWQANQPTATPVERATTRISTLTTGDPGHAYTLLRQRMLDSGSGEMVSVTDEDAFQAIHMLAELEGLSIEPAAAIAFAGLAKLVKAGQIDREAVVVVNCSGHTMSVEEAVIGEANWQELQLQSEGPIESPKDGLYAALAHLDDRRTRRVLVVDDNADSRRLIRRILGAHGKFEVLEAEDGPSALTMARADPPDLLVLDLMMPDMDGFDVLEQLRDQPQTRTLPVIVVTAKNLTTDELRRLSGQISRLLTKGDFLNEDLVQEIQRALD